jgi:hypothetical protein
MAAQTPLRFSLLAVLALLAIAVVALQPSYDTNDDVFMTMIVSGQGFCPAPDEHLIFTNVIIGQALKWLYTACPHFPWYGCYLLFVHYLAQLVLLYCALSTDVEGVASVSMRRRFALYLVYFALVELLFLNNLQFTTTAFLAAQAGIFVLLFVTRRRAQQSDAAVTLPLCAAVLIFVVAGLIRLESLSMALLVAAPLGFWLLRQASRQVLVKSGMAAGLAAMLIMLATAYDRMSYEHDPRWSGFFSYNQLRVKFNDYGWTSYTPRTANVFSAVGWTQNDHDMIAHWFFDDPVIYSESHLRGILEAYPWKSERLTMGYCWQIGRGILRDRSIWAVVLVLPFFLASVNRDTHARWAIIGCAITAVALVAFLTWNNKTLPTRVYFPLLSFPLSVALLFPAGSAITISPRVEQQTKGSGRTPPAWFTRKARPPWARPVIVSLVVGVVMGIHHQCRHSVVVHRDRRAFQTFLADLQSSGRDLYVCWEAAMPFELISPLDSLRSWSQIPLLNLVWTQRTVWQDETKRRFGISSLAQAICERDDVILVATPAHRALFATFAKEHFQSDVEFVPSANVGEKLVAGRFQRRALPGDTAGKRTDAVQR